MSTAIANKRATIDATNDDAPDPGVAVVVGSGGSGSSALHLN